MSTERGAHNAESKPALVCFALKEEAGAFRKRAPNDGTVSILVTGIGKENTRRTLLERLDQVRPALVLTCGFAGGLDPKLASGEVLFSTEDSTLSTKLSAADAKRAKFNCASRIATTVAEKAELRRTTGADAVEMESEVVHQICRDLGIPCATARVISDTATENLPLDFNLLSKPDLSLDFGKLILAVAKSPAKIPALLRLQKNCSAAADKLAVVLMKVVAE
jgi:nucleoside phosphorylase